MAAGIVVPPSPPVLEGIHSIAFDMETSDPDDFITLLWLASHPRVRLRCVTVFPGSQSQVDLIHWALTELGLGDVPIGVGGGTIKDEAATVSGWHYKAYGQPPPSGCQHVDAWRVLCRHCDEYTTLVTGAPLKNVAMAMEAGGTCGEPPFTVGAVACQGGFVGSNFVSPEHTLPKFWNRETCPTWNLGGCIPAAEAVLRDTSCVRDAKCFISKNVCHANAYDEEVHELLRACLLARDSNPESTRQQKGLTMIHRGMQQYLTKRDNKALHDPLAAVCAIQRDVCLWIETQLYCDASTRHWGCRTPQHMNTTGVYLPVAFDRLKFVQTFLDVTPDMYTHCRGVVDALALPIGPMGRLRQGWWQYNEVQHDEEEHVTTTTTGADSTPESTSTKRRKKQRCVGAAWAGGAQQKRTRRTPDDN